MWPFVCQKERSARESNRSKEPKRSKKKTHTHDHNNENIIRNVKSIVYSKAEFFPFFFFLWIPLCFRSFCILFDQPNNPERSMSITAHQFFIVHIILHNDFCTHSVYVSEWICYGFDVNQLSILFFFSFFFACSSIFQLIFWIDLTFLPSHVIFI